MCCDVLFVCCNVASLVKIFCCINVYWNSVAKANLITRAEGSSAHVMFIVFQPACMTNNRCRHVVELPPTRQLGIVHYGIKRVRGFQHIINLTSALFVLEIITPPLNSEHIFTNRTNSYSNTLLPKTIIPITPIIYVIFTFLQQRHTSIDVHYNLHMHI